MNQLEKIAVLSVQFVQYSFEYFIESMEKCGVKNIEFWGALPHYCRLNYKSSEEAHESLKSIRKKLEEKGMKVIMYTPETLAYPYSFSHPEESVRNRTIRYFEDAFLDALILGTNRVFINSGCGLRNLDWDTSWKNTVSTIRKICAEAQKYDVELVLEQLQPYESNLVCTLADIERMLEDVGYENLKVCLDVVAMEVSGDTIDDFFKALGNRIVHIHLADSNHQILGEGEYPVGEYLLDITKNKFEGYISLEINDSIYWLNPHDSIWKSMYFLDAYKRKIH
nr:TIM barrel protein [Proteiniclasticum sp.]